MVREIEIEKLNAAPYNPRIELTPGMAEWDKIKNSIQTFGMVEPIVWNENTGNVVGGHQRLSVIKSLGYKTVPCSVVNLSIEDEKILNVALNKIKGKWDFEKLASVLESFDYEVATASGFSEDEIAIILASSEDLIDDDFAYDWQNDGGGELLGGSYIVTLIFSSPELAAAWAETEGYEKQIKTGTSTTVIRIDPEE